MHSSLSVDEQQKVFDYAPPGRLLVLDKVARWKLARYNVCCFCFFGVPSVSQEVLLDFAKHMPPLSNRLKDKGWFECGDKSA